MRTTISVLVEKTYKTFAYRINNKIYNCVQEAERELGISQTKINRALNGYIFYDLEAERILIDKTKKIYLPIKQAQRLGLPILSTVEKIYLDTEEATQDNIERLLDRSEADKIILNISGLIYTIEPSENK